MTHRPATTALLAVILLALAGCGTDQVEQTQEAISEVAVIPDDASPTPTGLASAVPTEPVGGGSLAGDPVSCDPTGTELDATATVQVEVVDGAMTLDTEAVDAGTLRFEVTNAGQEPHEVLIVRADGPDALPSAASGGVDESAIEEGLVVGEIGTFPAGETCPGVFDLIPGDYVLLCNVVEAAEGENVSHVERGEWARLTVGE